MIPGIVLFPHCDLHLSLDDPELGVQVFRRTMSGFQSPYDLVPIAGADVRFDFYAPHAPEGQRYQNLPVVQPDGRVVATTPGIYLFQCTADTRSIVGRLQVHQAITDWWFGNDSITTAVDTVAHAQPTIYARFTPDDTGTDLVGDITGHGYVALESSDEGKVELNPLQRLRGIAETGDQPVNLIGSYLNVVRQLPVRVVDYRRRRDILEPVVHDPIGDHLLTPNLVFLGEGFTASDQIAFDEIVEDVYMDMFIKPRHEPFPMLMRSMNVYKAPVGSTQGLLTPGFRVVDHSDLKGMPVPLQIEMKGLPADAYTVPQLTLLAGLPKRGENRSVEALRTDWGTQHLDGLDLARVHPPVVERWRAQGSTAALQAHDTFFGLHLGRRLADRESDNHPVPNPGADGDQALLPAFVRKLYTFYQTGGPHNMQLDPRRHPPELYGENMENPLTSVSTFVRGLAESLPPHRHVGPEWIPDGVNLKLSRGLIIVIAKDFMHGGQNIEHGLACLTLNSRDRTGFASGSPSVHTRRRTGASALTYDKTSVSDLAIHELGHSFRLGDEYEENAGRAPAVGGDGFDNLTSWTAIADPANPGRFLPERVKWLGLIRIRFASRVRDVQPLPDGIRVTVPPEDIPHWERVRLENPAVLLQRALSLGMGQIPLIPGEFGNLMEFHMGSSPDPVAATIDLTGPPTPFGKDSILLSQLRNTRNEPLFVTERRVLDFLRNPEGRPGRPLNVDVANDPNGPGPHSGPDLPREISASTPGNPPGRRVTFTPANPSSQTIGVYEGGLKYAQGIYRPAGSCKMRNQHQSGDDGKFCFVCQWLIVNRLNPSLHRTLDLTYSLGTPHA
ncbi:hypothetical protein [Streptosporangium sp. G12]